MPLICDVELLAQAQPKNRFVGVTGTNGKSTTTALIGHILKSAGASCEVGGNIGRGALDLAPLGPHGIYVLELSSYQLELLQTFHAHVAVWLNITPDHLDRHGDMAGYVAAKMHIFDRQDERDCAVIGVDDDYSRAVFAEYGKARQAQPDRRRAGGARSPARGGRFVPRRPADRRRPLRGQLRRRADPAGRPQRPERRLRLGGLPLAAACRARRSSAAIRSYPGLPHRQEQVAARGQGRLRQRQQGDQRRRRGARAVVLRDIYWILGGQAKEGGVEALEPCFDRIRHAFLIGEATELFAGQLEGKLPFDRCGDLQSALDAAHARAQAEATSPAVVLLSPACASLDQSRSFEHRGDAFREMARALPGAERVGRAA